MRLFALAVTLSLVSFTIASAQTATPDSEIGRYSFSPVADGVLRLDTRTGQVSQCSRSDAGWACKMVPDERSALETEIRFSHAPAASQAIARRARYAAGAVAASVAWGWRLRWSWRRHRNPLPIVAFDRHGYAAMFEAAVAAFAKASDERKA